MTTPATPTTNSTIPAATADKTTTAGLSTVCLIVGCGPTRHHCRPATSTSRDGGDPVLAALAHLRSTREDAHTQLRLLLAYARTYPYPRPYTLASLADAAQMSISGARTAYTPRDISTVAQRLGVTPRPLATSGAAYRKDAYWKERRP